MKILILCLLFCNNAWALVGGEEASENEFPYILSLQGINADVSFHYCGASVIAPGLIMTAAHCLREENTKEKYRPGDLLAFKTGAVIKDTTLKSTQIKQIHYAPSKRDIAIIEVQGFQKPPFAKLASKINLTKKVWLTGHGPQDFFGDPGGEYLKKAAIRITSSSDTHYSSPSDPEGGFYPSLAPGDSGSPALIETPDGLQVIGVNSSIHLTPSRDAGQNDVARTDTAEIRSWVQEIIESSFDTEKDSLESSMGTSCTWHHKMKM
ncbi:MAG: S1 family peptidase [Bdellovibrio sp.]|nr:S1 family peptidase [Bdellovibrio sp.]